MNEMKELFENLGAYAKTALLPAVLLLVIGILVIRIVMRIVKKGLEKSKLEKAAHSLIKTVIRVVLYGLLALMTASRLGIDVTGVVALASVLTLAISLSVQNALTNVMGGFTLLYTKPFSSGDFVEIAGQSGTVQEIGFLWSSWERWQRQCLRCRLPVTSLTISSMDMPCTAMTSISHDLVVPGKSSPRWMSRISRFS